MGFQQFVEAEEHLNTQPECYLMSHQGALLAAGPQGLHLLAPETLQDPTPLLRLPPGIPLQGFSAARLTPHLARAFLVTGKTPGTVGIMHDDAFLSAPDTSAPTFSARHFGPAEQWRLIPATGLLKPHPPEIWIQPMGNVGNRLLQYLAAEGIRAQVPGAEITHVSLPEFGLQRSAPNPAGPGAVHTGEWRFWLDTPGLAGCLRRGVMQSLIINSYCFHLDHYPPRAVCRTLLGPCQGGEDAPGFGPEDLVCSVRAGEILTAIHPGYLPLPPGYYAKLAEQTGLNLVFYGQLGDDPYSASLRAAFPTARFIPGRNPGYDFEVLRRSQNLALSLSTFSWAAAWLGHPAQVHVPVGGIFNPMLEGNLSFLPLDEPGWHFMLMPYAKATDLFTAPEAFFAQQDFIAAQTRPASPDELRALCARAILFQPHGPYVCGFDPAFYTAAYGPTAPQNPLEQYLHQGYKEGKQPVPFDPDFYVKTYPEAAMTMATGEYLSPLHHFLVEGWRKGYAPTPPRGL